MIEDRVRLHDQMSKASERRTSASPEDCSFQELFLGNNVICLWIEHYITMSAAQRMPIVGGTLAIGVTGAAMALIPSLREAVTRYLGISAPGGVWRILAIVFALLSLKSLPFVWHVRLPSSLSSKPKKPLD